MAKISCPSCGAEIEFPTGLVKELAAEIGSSVKETKDLLAKVAAAMDKAPAPAPTEPTPTPQPPKKVVGGLLYDESE